jgi:nicotinamidase/pyrazinamidase
MEVHIVGVATDYCVKFTALDAMELGFKVIVHKNCVRGVELNPGDIEKALEEMKAAGIEIY